MARSEIIADDFSGGLSGDYAQLNTFDGSITVGSGLVYGSHANGADNRMAVRYTAGSFSDDQYASVTIQTLAFISSDYSIGAVVRASADTDGNRDMYWIEVHGDSGGPTYTTQIHKIVNGTRTQLASGSVAWASGDEIELEVQGTTLTGMKNGVAIGGAFTLTDSALSTGRPGISGSGGSGTVNGTAWSAGDITGGGGGGFVPYPNPRGASGGMLSMTGGMHE